MLRVDLFRGESEVMDMACCRLGARWARCAYSLSKPIYCLRDKPSPIEDVEIIFSNLRTFFENLCCVGLMVFIKKKSGVKNKYLEMFIIKDFRKIINLHEQGLPWIGSKNLRAQSYRLDARDDIHVS